MSILIRTSRPLRIVPNLIVSISMGYLLWILISIYIPITRTLECPLSFYNIPATWHITSPDTIIVRIQARRTDLVTIAHDMHIHINAETLAIGDNYIDLQPESLFLPISIKLINYTPAHIRVTVTE